MGNINFTLALFSFTKMAMPPFLRVCVNCQNFEIVVTKRASCGAAVGAFVTRRIAEKVTPEAKLFLSLF